MKHYEARKQAIWLVKNIIYNHFKWMKKFSPEEYNRYEPILENNIPFFVNYFLSKKEKECELLPIKKEIFKSLNISYKWLELLQRRWYTLSELTAWDLKEKDLLDAKRTKR